MEVSGQLSNHEIREEIHAIWSMTRILADSPRVRNWQRDRLDRHVGEMHFRYSGRAFWTIDKPPNAEYLRVSQYPDR